MADAQAHRARMERYEEERRRVMEHPHRGKSSTRLAEMGRRMERLESELYAVDIGMALRQKQVH